MYTAEYWQYDARVGRRWNIDPIIKEFASPYSTFSNNPIYYIDELGLDSEDPKYKELSEVRVYASKKPKPKEGDERESYKMITIKDPLSTRNWTRLSRFQTDTRQIKVYFTEKYHQGSKYFEKGWYKSTNELLEGPSDYDLTQFDWDGGQVMKEDSWETYLEFALEGGIYTGTRDWNGFEVNSEGYLTGGRTLNVIENNAFRTIIGARKYIDRLGRLMQLTKSRTNVLNTIKDSRLRNVVNDLFRQGSTIGNGSSMAAFRYELRTGLTVRGKSHGIKLLNYRQALIRILKQPLNKGDRKLAELLLKDIKNALKGN